MTEMDLPATDPGPRSIFTAPEEHYGAQADRALQQFDQAQERFAKLTDGIAPERIAELEQRAAKDVEGWEGFTPDWTNLPFIGAVVNTSEQVDRARLDVRFDAGVASLEEREKLLEAEVRDRRHRTTEGKIGEAAIDSATLIAEFLIGGFGAGKAANKIAGREIIKKARDEASRSVQQQLLKGAAGAVGSTTLRGATEALSRIAGYEGGAWTSTSIRRALPKLDLSDDQAEMLATLAEEDFAGRFLPLVAEKHPIYKSMLEDGLTSGIEGMGGPLLKLVPGIAPLRAAQGRLFQKLAGEGVEGVLRGLGSAAGYTGVVGEVAEEIIQGIAAEGLFGEGWRTGLPQSFEELLVIASVSAMPAGLAVTTARAIELAQKAKRTERAATAGGGAESASVEAEPVPVVFRTEDLGRAVQVAGGEHDGVTGTLVGFAEQNAIPELGIEAKKVAMVKLEDGTEIEVPQSSIGSPAAQGTGGRQGASTATGGDVISGPGDATAETAGVDPGVSTAEGEAPPQAVEPGAMGMPGRRAADSVADAAMEAPSATRDTVAALDSPQAFNALDATYSGPETGIEQTPIGRDLFGSLEPVEEVTAGKTVSAPDVMNALGGIVAAAGENPVIRQGMAAHTSKGARGSYWLRSKVVDVRKANDIRTGSHEVAHNLEAVVFGETNPWEPGGKASLSDSQRAELEQLGRDLYGDTEPNGGYLREGWAELMSYYITQDGTGKAPEMMQWMEETFLPQNPKIADAIRKAQDHARVWRMQGSVGRARQSVVGAKGGTAQAVEKVKEGLSAKGVEKFLDAWVEELGPLRRAAKFVEQKTGKQLNPSKNPYKSAKALRQTAASRVKYMIDRGMIDLAGNRTGVRALSEIKKIIDKRGEDFSIYLFARRAKALWEQPLVERAEGGRSLADVLEREREVYATEEGLPPAEAVLLELGARDPGISYEDAQRVLEEVGDRNLEMAAELVYQWYDGVMDYVAESSPTLAEAVQKMREVDPGAYVPLRRVFKALEGRSSRAGNAARGSVAKRLKGSGRQVKDPLEQLIAQSTQMVELAHQRFVLDSVIALGRSHEGLGGMIREVPVSQVPNGSISVDEALRQAAKKVASEDGDLAAEIESIRDTLGDSADAVLTMFAQSRAPKQDGEAPILPVVEKGKVKWFQVDPDIYESLAGINPKRIWPIVDLFFGVPKRLFTAGTTQLSASFALVANPARDFHIFAANTRAGNTARMMGNYFGSILSAFNASTGVTKDTETYADFMLRSGVRMAQMHKEDGASTRALARRLSNRGLKLKTYAGDSWEMIKDVMNTPELIPRIGEMRAAADEMGWDPSQQLDMDTAVELINAGKGVTVDFGGAGKIARRINQFVPFFNVAIQSPRALARSFKRNPRGFILGALLRATIPALAYWWMNKDEEWYQEMPDEQKYSYFYVRVGDEVIRAPRAWDFHYFFATIPEIMANSWFQEDPEGATGFAERIAGMSGLIAGEGARIFTPGVLPVPVSAYVEHQRNEDFFFGSPIVPRGLEEAHPEDQYNEYTSRAARAVGDALGISPMVFEHYVSSTFGTLGRDALQMTGRDIDAVEREDTLADLPIVGRLFQRGGVEGVRSKYVEQIYDLSDRLKGDYIARKQDGEEEPPRVREERLFVGDAVRAMSSLSRLRVLAKTDEERRKLDRERRELAREVIEDHRAGTWRRMKGRVRQLQRQEDAAERQFYEKVRDQ